VRRFAPYYLRQYFENLKNGQIEYRNLLIEHNLRLVSHVIKRNFYTYNYDIESLYQVGAIGLIKAVDRYDKSKASFSCYAITCIRNEILMWIRKNKNNRWDESLQEEITDMVQKQDLLEDLSILIEDSVIIKEQYDRLYQAFDQLSLEDQEILHMYYIENKKQSEIAMILKCCSSNISRKMKKSLIHLRKNYQYLEQNKATMWKKENVK